MTRIAILADIHGNPPALEAVIQDLQRRDVDEILHAGDLVGRGPAGSAVVQRIRELGWRGVRGNHEDYLLKMRAGRVASGALHPDALACARWMAEELSADEARWIAALPDALNARLAPEIRVVHGSPRSNREGIGPWTSAPDLLEIVEPVQESVLACAHTHRPLQREAAGTLVVNVGSVGLPFNGDPAAQYAVFERRADGWHAEHVRVPYDRAELLSVYRRSGFRDAGGVAAQLLEREVITARSHLVPFESWARATDQPMDRDSLEAFLDRFDPLLPLSTFLALEAEAEPR